MSPPPVIVVPSWANGPTGTGNGGWTSALLAPHVRGGETGVAVDLRSPPPLGRPLRIADGAEGGVELWDDDAGDEPVLVARAAPASVLVDVPESVRAITRQQASAASVGFPFRVDHPFPHCLVCGIDRRPDEPAFCLHCGPVEGVAAPDANHEPTQVFADAWTPTADLAEQDDPAVASLAACWAALDCPSAAPLVSASGAARAVLARFVVRLDQRATIGAPHVVASWAQSVDGRKHRSRSALLDTTGVVLGVAEALWIEVRTS